MSIAVLLERCPATDEVVVNLNDGELVSVLFVKAVSAAKLNAVARALFQMAENLHKSREALRKRKKRKPVPRE